MINGGVLPEISVIVCSHNHDKWIERCVRSLAHQEDIAAAAVEKMRRAESLVSEIQKDIATEREASTSLQRQKVSLEKSLNEAQLKLVDLETKGYSSASQDIKFLHKRIQEASSPTHRARRRV